MTHSSDDKNYVRAVLSYLGIDFDEADIVLSVCHCQSDELSLPVISKLLNSRMLLIYMSIVSLRMK